MERQRQDCEALAKRLGWEIVAEHTDNDLSAYSGKPRPGYRAVLADLEAGRADAVLVWHTDRLHRSPRDLEDFIDLAEKRKVLTETVAAGSLDLNTASGRMVARMLGAAARQEVELKSERTKRQQLQAAQSGRFLGGATPLGWTLKGNGGAVLDAAAAKRIRKATADVIAGKSLGSIVKAWNADGFKGATGSKWTHQTVRQVLCRGRNAGLIELHGEVVGKSQWPAIVDEDSWRACRSILSDPKRRVSRSNAVRWLLAGIAVCGHDTGNGEICGQPMKSAIAGTPNGRRKSREVYRCMVPGSGHVSIGAHDLDKFVTARLLDQLRWPNFWDRYAEATTSDAERLAELRSEEATLTARIEQTRQAFIESATMNPTDAAMILDGLRTKLEAVQAKRQEAEAAQTKPIKLDPADVERQWNRLTIEEKRIVLREALTSLVIFPSQTRGPKFDSERVGFGWSVEAVPGPDEYAARAEWRRDRAALGEPVTGFRGPFAVRGYQE